MNGAFNLDVALSALETQGNVQLLSTPRVSTQNNVEAEITRRAIVQIPMQTVANNYLVTVARAFKDAALTLKVMPQITAAGTVIMKIDGRQRFARRHRASTASRSINTQRARRPCSSATGQTTVIGGIYETLEARSQDRTPGLSRVPFIGSFFKRNESSSNEGELLIFITPRILKNAEAVAAQTNPVNEALGK